MTPKQVKFYLALSQFGKDFTAFKDINNSRIRELGQLQDAAGVDSTKTFLLTRPVKQLGTNNWD